MSAVEALLDNAYQDTQLLLANDEKGDDFSVPRDVDFVFYTPDQQKAETVAAFANDNNYGTALVSRQGDNHSPCGSTHANDTKQYLLRFRAHGLYSANFSELNMTGGAVFCKPRNKQIKSAHFVRPTLASSRGLCGRYAHTEQ